MSVGFTPEVLAAEQSLREAWAETRTVTPTAKVRKADLASVLNDPMRRAAPELYRQLEWLVKLMANGDWAGADHAAKKFGNAALAKARGDA